MKKMIYLISDPYWKRDHHRFGAEYLMSKGYDVEIWRILEKDSVDYSTQAGMYEGDNLHGYTWDEFRAKAGDNHDAVYLVFNPRAMYTSYVAKRGYRFIIITGLGGVIRPEYAEYRDGGSIHLGKLLLRKIKRAKEKGLRKCVTDRIKYVRNKKAEAEYRKAIKRNPPAFIATSTHTTANRFLLPEELSGNVMYIHAMDYDRYIEAEREYPPREKKHIVYCDSGFADMDYDTVLFNDGVEMETAKHKGEYFDQLEELFTRLEEHYGVPVIVMGHPHTKYEPGDFHGREITFNRIAELTRDAVAFVLNTSTAQNFPAIYDVPTVKIVNRHFRGILQPEPNCYEFIRWEADVTGCGFLDMDDREAMGHPWDFVLPIDRKKRELFLEQYVIDSDVTDKTVYECVEEFIRRMG